MASSFKDMERVAKTFATSSLDKETASKLINKYSEVQGFATERNQEDFRRRMHCIYARFLHESLRDSFAYDHSVADDQVEEYCDFAGVDWWTEVKDEKKAS